MVPVTPPHNPDHDEAHGLGGGIGPYLGGQIGALRDRVAAANTPASLDGLLARHILGDQAGLAWNVRPPPTWLSSAVHRVADPAALAVLGYIATTTTTTTTTTTDADVNARLLAGLPRLMQRDLFPGDRLSFVHNMRILIGVALATRAIRTDLPDATTWLSSVLIDPRLQPSDTLHELVRQHTHATLTNQPFRLPDLRTLTGPGELAMAYWTLTRGTGQLADPHTHTLTLQQRVLGAALTTDPADLTPVTAALLMHAASSIVTASIDHLLHDRSHVGAVLGRFPAAMRRWRWDPETLQHPIRWEIGSEREVQDILWIMLRSVFDDVIDEDTLPKVGHSSYRADFGLPRLGVLLEVKYARQADDFKKIEQEVMIDSVAYLKNTDRYHEIVVFIYDDSASGEHHDLTRRTLLDLGGVTDVIIASRPGMLPAPSGQRPPRIHRSTPAKTTTGT
jgi:REase_DpnII-MboI